jgi:hypothetical protein
MNTTSGIVSQPSPYSVTESIDRLYHFNMKLRQIGLRE